MQSSGTSKLPALLPYPKLLDWSETPELRDILCYVLPYYGQTGLAVLLCRQPPRVGKQLVTVFGDWAGNKLDPHGELPAKFLDQHWHKFAQLFQLARMQQAQFFLVPKERGMMLVDIQTELNRLCGPGLIRDLFGNIIDVPQTVALSVMDDKAREQVALGAGDFAGDLIIKPSKFRSVERPGGATPLFVKVKR